MTLVSGRFPLAVPMSPSQEDRPLDLLGKGEGYTHALAHGYDIGGHTDDDEEVTRHGDRIITE